ncbi:MAG: OmpA family protein [Gemmataceae bacterium]|nr:OmpA family protein [Gemmataceae bacterium]
MATDIEQGPYPSTTDEPSARLCNFATGSSTLLASHKAWIDKSFVPAVKSDPRLYVQSAGLASRVGREAANQKLAFARAQAVVDYVEQSLGRSLLLTDVGSYGESLSGGKANDNDGFYRGVFLSASAYGFEPPKYEPISRIGELKKWDEGQLKKVRDAEMRRVWIGAGVKAGGTAVFVGLEDTEGAVLRADTFREACYVGVTSFRAGIGLGVSGNPVAMIMFNTPDPTFFNGESTSDWGVNFAFGPSWSKLAKALTEYKFFQTIAKVAKLGWATATPADMEDIRNALHILYSSLGAAATQGPNLVCIDCPVGGVGAEASVVATWGKIRIWR